MCGIAGIVSSEAGGFDADTIHRMCQTIVHRGPDDEGIFFRNGVGLGMRRLSIIDVAGGHQPVSNEDGTVWVVYNGEIYNFPELRRELEKRGHRFSTRTDTEVIVHLYEERGADCVHELRGMFAFALYDERRRRLLLARDRLGIKPLHYAAGGGRLLFGSEIKAILAAAPELAAVDREGLLQYLCYGYIPDPATSFSGIRKLPPGHLLEFENGEARVRQYWDLPAYGTHEPASEEECLQELEHRLAEAVRIRLIADVPLGALLSGGTDSSTVVALMARASSAPVKTFAIGFKQEDFNEAPHARKVAERFGTDHHELILEPDVVATVESLSRSLEEPFADSSMLPTYFVSCLARRHVTVALSGDGGDELFAGYDRYRVHHDREIFERIPGWLGRLYRERVYPGLPVGLRGRKFAYNASLPWRERYTDMVTFLHGLDRGMGLLSDDLRSELGGAADPRDVLLDALDRASAPDQLSRILYADTKTYLVGDILTKVDRMSMLTSLEVRVPILDHVFVEWVTGLGSRWKMREGGQKYILRKLAERVGVPREVLERPKQGFALPLVHWIRHELKDMILTLLLERRSLERGYFDGRAVRRLLDEHFQGRRDHSACIWLLLMFELWHRNFVDTACASPELPPAVLTASGTTAHAGSAYPRVG
ncbi:MAG TPA: asparagine synthase (glutamine-hydrolyzing) [Terriglobia bacterium]|jgi:asparagine synthase (glutamine-hydrolysing)|nr:asparagine synthase (glutamine-hydrolyzing) [Terriglobia bacterium]